MTHLSPPQRRVLARLASGEGMSWYVTIDESSRDRLFYQFHSDSSRVRADTMEKLREAGLVEFRQAHPGEVMKHRVAITEKGREAIQ